MDVSFSCCVVHKRACCHHEMILSYSWTAFPGVPDAIGKTCQHQGVPSVTKCYACFKQVECSPCWPLCPEILCIVSPSGTCSVEANRSMAAGLLCSRHECHQGKCAYGNRSSKEHCPGSMFQGMLAGGNLTGLQQIYRARPASQRTIIIGERWRVCMLQATECVQNLSYLSDQTTAPV